MCKNLYELGELNGLCKTLFTQDATMTRTLACRQRDRDEVVLRNALQHGGERLLGDRKGRGFGVAEDKNRSVTPPHHEDRTNEMVVLIC